MIELRGPAGYPTVTLLRGMLRYVPEQGVFTMGGPKVLATEQLRRFEEAGLRVPEWTTNQAQANEWAFRDAEIVLGRKENHTQGRDIIIVPNDTRYVRQRQRWQTRDWWCKFVPSTAEWRIHVFDGRCIARGKKLFHDTLTGRGTMPQGYPDGNTTGIAIRSRARGWLLRHDVEPPEAVRIAGRGAVEVLGYPYGAVDILETVGGPVVLEVNRLPAMDHYTATAYVHAIRRYVAGRRVPRMAFPGAAPYEGVEVW